MDVSFPSRPFSAVCVLLVVTVLSSTAHGANYCGTSFRAASKCKTSCPRGLDSECPSVERCFASVTCNIVTLPQNSCGFSFRDARKCQTACPRGLDGECPAGERCFANIACGTAAPPPPPPPPSSSSFPASVVSAAVAEHATYGGGDECGSRALRARVGQYWRALGRSLDGCDTSVPWSAAFISYVIREAGAGNRFAYSAAHRVYIADAFDGGRGLYNTVQDTASATVRTGDLVCSGRGSVRGWRYADFLDWHRHSGRSIPTHCDVVTGVSGSRVTTIGGNLSNTVRRQTVSKTSYAIVLSVTQ